MAIDATVQILHQGERNLVIQITGFCDGEGDNNINQALLIDASTLSPPARQLKLRKISGHVDGGILELYWDALTPVKFEALIGQIELDYTRAGGLPNNAVEPTGDVLMSTKAFEQNSTYNLLIEMVKKR